MKTLNYSLLLGLIVPLGLQGDALAVNSIAFDMPGNLTGMSSTATAGIVPQQYWNSITSQGTAFGWPCTAGAAAQTHLNKFTAAPAMPVGQILDSNGVNLTTGGTPTTLTYSYFGNYWSNGITGSGGNNLMMKGVYSDRTTSSTGTPTPVSVTNIPYATYNVYVYLGTIGGTEPAHQVVVNGQSLWYIGASDSWVSGTWRQATATTAGTATASDYMLFQNLSGPLTLSLTDINTGAPEENTGIAGFQIVEVLQANGVPEPSTYALGLIGLLGLGVCACGGAPCGDNLTITFAISGINEVSTT